MLAEGSVFAAYEVRRRIAVGGMGEVYLCRHRLLDRLDAVKVLRPHLASDMDFRRRFLREALSVARLRHPNVVTVYTADEADGLLFLAMEYVAADDLATVLARTGAMAAARVVNLLRGVADALDAAHRAQLVHRDIKPSNLLVSAAGTAEERVTLVDFGISRMLDSDTDITRAGQIVGTIAYCAPEQLSQYTIGGASDQYALACVAYECLAGVVPFPRESQLAIVTAHLTAPPPLVRAMRPDLPEAVDAVLTRAMAKDPRDRFRTCSEFLTALTAASAEQTSPASIGIEPMALFPGPDALRETIHSGFDGSLGQPRPLRLRVGVPAAPDSPGSMDHTTVDVAGAVAVVVDFGEGPYAVRGSAADTGALVRWLVAQAVVRHRDRDLCLVCAIAPDAEDRFMWLNWLPHARPGNPPLSGPHVATTPESAHDLLTRLGAVVAGRRGDPLPRPRVLAILDSRLGVAPDDERLAGAGRSGVHVVHLGAPGDRVPAGVSTLDLDGGTLLWRRPGRPVLAAVPDGVSAAYARELSDELPD